ncbi:MAG: hypothetical protein AB1405_02865 [Bdellovibrionota bacterium]
MRRLLPITLLLAALFAPRAAGAEEPPAKTLGRQLDPVVVVGNPLRALWGRKITQLRLFALRNGRFEPIPYQIDKKNPEGEFLLETGEVPEYVRKEVGLQGFSESRKRALRIQEFEKKQQKKKLNPQAAASEREWAYFNEQMEELDYNDQLVFMARDAGGRTPYTRWPTTDGVELEITDPTNGAKAWVYLLHFLKDPPPPSPEDYIRYDSKADRIDARLGVLDFADGKPMILETVSGRLPDGTSTPNFLDRFKLRVRVLPIPLACVPLFFDENNARAFTIGYKDGPVRVIRRTVFWLVIGGLKLPFVPRITMNFLFYENGLATDARFKSPVDASYVICPGSYFRAGLDLRKSALGAKVFTKDNQELLFDGKMPEKEKKFIGSGQHWIAGVLPDGTALLSRMRYDPQLIRKGVIPDFYFLDDSSKNDTPEAEPGQHFIGYEMDVRKFPKGTYQIGFQVYVTQSFRPGQEQELLRIDDAPLKVTRPLP